MKKEFEFFYLKKIMKIGVLFSGGKDSTYALFKVMNNYEVVCLITMLSKNKESYMFHTPNIEITSLQSKCIGLPLLVQETKGEKEKEILDLEKSIKRASEQFGIEGIVTGAIKSKYQNERIKKLCKKIGVKYITPLWGIDQIKLLKELLINNFEIIISGISAYPLESSWLGRKIDEEVVLKLSELQKKYQVNPAGEGGEIETTVLDAPFFKKRIEVIESEILYKNNYGVFQIKKARLVNKNSFVE